MGVLILDLVMPREQYLSLYTSYIRQVKATARNGQTVRFPVGVLQPFVTQEGVRGTFRLHFDANNKFVAMERM